MNAAKPLRPSLTLGHLPCKGRLVARAKPARKAPHEVGSWPSLRGLRGFCRFAEAPRWTGCRGELCPHQPPAGGSFSLRAKSRRKKRRLRSDTRLRAQSRGRSQREKHPHGANHAGAYFLCQYQPNILIRIPAATAEPITPATLGPMACMSR